MPYPQNIEVARLVEADIREAGAVPATMAVLEGVLHVGLTDTQLETLAQAKNVAKLSRADMAVCIASGGTGATTVAATMIAAQIAGISVFATGGIGGVHKGAENSFDISADLLGTGANAGNRCRGRGQGHPRYSKNSGSSRDARRAGHCLWAG